MTLKLSIVIFLTVENQTFRPTSLQNKREQMISVSSTQQRFFLLFLLAATKSSLTVRT